MATEFRLGEWAQAMKEKKAKGQSVAEFCQGRGISRNTYFYWQRRLREAAARHLVVAAAEQPQAMVPRGWATVGQAEDIAPAEQRGLTLRVGGAEIEVREGYDEALLASVCRTLSSLC